MKVIKRDLIIYNVILFVLTSIVFLHVSFSLDAEISAINLERFLGLINDIPFVLALGLITIASIFKIKKEAVYFLGLFTLIVFYKAFSIFLISYSKFQLLLSVAYLIVSYNIILLLKSEMELSIFNPKYEVGTFAVKEYSIINCTINDFAATVTNMDSSGFFAKLEDEKIDLRGDVDFDIFFSGKSFKGKGFVATSFDSGIGIRVRKNAPTVIGWKDLYTIISQRGIFHES